MNNILSIEVLTLAVPCINNLIDESYILLDLGSQLNTWEAGPNRTRAFQVFYPAPRVNWWPSKPEPPNIDSNVPLGLIVYDKKSAERSPTIFYPSKPRINDLFLTLRDRFGQPLDIGSDSNSADLISNKDCQWSVTLKITCSVPPNLTSQRFGN